MPKDFTEAETYTLFPPDVQHLYRLADALEHEHKGFTWDFSTVYAAEKCGTFGCAIGLAAHIGMIKYRSNFYSHEGKRNGRFPDRDDLREKLRISEEELDRIFYCASTYGFSPKNGQMSELKKAFNSVTPQMVAAELRRVAARKLGEEQ